MQRFEIEITGITALLQHRMPQEALFALLGAKTKKKPTIEELTPRDIAEKHCYKTKEGLFYVPAEYFSGAFKHVASDYAQKNSARKSLKGVAGGVFRPETEMAILTDEKGKALKDFEVDIRKATNHLKGAVAVCRPRFDRWATKFIASIDESIVDPQTVLHILNDSGKRAGIGSFRVAKSGYFGQFSVTKFKRLPD